MLWICMNCQIKHHIIIMHFVEFSFLRIAVCLIMSKWDNKRNLSHERHHIVLFSSFSISIYIYICTCLCVCISVKMCVCACCLWLLIHLSHLLNYYSLVFTSCPLDLNSHFSTCILTLLFLPLTHCFIGWHFMILFDSISLAYDYSVCLFV